MRDGAYKFCAFLFLSFLEWSRNFCAIASGMQPTNSNSDYETHLAARQWHWWSAVGAQGDRGEGSQSWHSGGHNHKPSGVGIFCGRNGDCGVIPN